MPGRPRLVKDPKRGDEIPLAALAERYDLDANTVATRYRAGKRGLDLIKPVDQQRRPPHMRPEATQKAPAHSRKAIIEAAMARPEVRQLTVRRLADLGRVVSASKGAEA